VTILLGVDVLGFSVLTISDSIRDIDDFLIDLVEQKSCHHFPTRGRDNSNALIFTLSHNPDWIVWVNSALHLSNLEPEGEIR